MSNYSIESIHKIAKKYGLSIKETDANEYYIIDHVTFYPDHCSKNTKSHSPATALLKWAEMTDRRSEIEEEMAEIICEDADITDICYYISIPLGSSSWFHKNWYTDDD